MARANAQKFGAALFSVLGFATLIGAALYVHRMLVVLENSVANVTFFLLLAVWLLVAMQFFANAYSLLQNGKGQLRLTSRSTNFLLGLTAYGAITLASGLFELGPRGCLHLSDPSHCAGEIYKVFE